MQREIKFRARHIKNKRWYYGIETDCKADSFLTLGVFWLWVEFGILDRKTVGESTGLNDKHKIKIYEGDLVIFDKDNDNVEPKVTVPVIWEHGCWMVGIHCRLHLAIICKQIEIIGNKWENPELLKPPMTSNKIKED